MVHYILLIFHPQNYKEMKIMSPPRQMLVMYGSQTGTAQAVAERIGREAKRYFKIDGFFIFLCIQFDGLFYFIFKKVSF